MLLHYSPYGLVSVYNLKVDLVYWLLDIISASTVVGFYGSDKKYLSKTIKQKYQYEMAWVNGKIY